MKRKSSRRDKLVVGSLLGFLGIWYALWTPLIVIFKCIPSKFNCNTCKDFEFCDRKYWMKTREKK